ncbi:unnamed protein product [Parnassius apollo]|uniref:(apollo) hypothetical protein n=1 Tax=Parnassius apollo TaxID=110799 RepID=A0A8S3VY76_PARAO|nr:unnamed protein product [Parnassius apollo]
MTSCAIKICRNYKGRLQTINKISYHRIPIDPIIRSRWVDIMRKSRGEEFWKPSKTTVICSEHFREKDLYFANNQGRRRLKKEAVPKKALFLSSVKSDESDITDEDVEMTMEYNTEKQKPMNLNTPASNEEPKTSSSIACTNVVCTDTSSPSISRVAHKVLANKTAKSENDIEINEEFSDIDSIFDTPKKAKLRRELRRKIRIQKKHSLKMQSLRRKKSTT